MVVEDDPHIADLVSMYLRNEGFRVHVATSGEDGLRAIRSHRPRLAIVDVGLPGELDGLGLCRDLRRSSAVPLILLTARDDEADRVQGLELGADDYVTKPFSPRELVARVRAVLRREEGRLPGGPVLQVGEVEIDRDRREVCVANRGVHLALREFDLLVHLAEHPGLALTRQQLLDAVWGPAWVGDPRTVDVHVRQLRKKLGDALPLMTVRGVGYRLG